MSVSWLATVFSWNAGKNPAWRERHPNNPYKISDDDSKDRVEFAVVADTSIDPDSWLVRSDVYEKRQLTPEQRLPFDKFRATSGGRFFLLPEDEQFPWWTKGVRAIYLMRYIANQSFSPWQRPESNGVPVLPEHAKHIPAMVHVTDAKHLTEICKYGL